MGWQALLGLTMDAYVIVGEPLLQALIIVSPVALMYLIGGIRYLITGRRRKRATKRYHQRILDNEATYFIDHLD